MTKNFIAPMRIHCTTFGDCLLANIKANQQADVRMCNHTAGSTVQSLCNLAGGLVINSEYLAFCVVITNNNFTEANLIEKSFLLVKEITGISKTIQQLLFFITAEKRCVTTKSLACYFHILYKQDIVAYIDFQHCSRIIFLLLTFAIIKYFSLALWIRIPFTHVCNHYNMHTLSLSDHLARHCDILYCMPIFSREV